MSHAYDLKLDDIPLPPPPTAEARALLTTSAKRVAGVAILLISF